jgi:hypothetical protein
MNPIFTRINSLTSEEQELNLSESDLYQYSQEDILSLFAAIPERIRHLNLSWNYSAAKTNEELIALFQAIPSTITHLNLCGNSLHLKSHKDLMALIAVFPRHINIHTEIPEFNQLLAELRLLKSEETPPFELNMTAPTNAMHQDTQEQYPLMQAKAPDLDAALTALKLPTPWPYQTATIADTKLLKLQDGPQESYIAKAGTYLQLKSQELPVNGLPEPFLRLEGFIYNQSTKQVLLYAPLPAPSNPEHPPKTLTEILAAPIKPTTTQIIDLITEIAQKVSYLNQGLVFYPSVEAIYITNTQEIGTEKPLTFKFCPSALKLRQELPPELPRHLVHQRMTAILALQLAIQSGNLQAPDVAKKMMQARSHSPALLALFTELWNAHQHPNAQEPDFIRLSPTLDALNQIRDRKKQSWSMEHLPALISGAACNHSFTISSVATEGLTSLLKTSSPRQQHLILELLAHHIEFLVPQRKSVLSDPASVSKSKHWINRMELLVQILQYMHQQGKKEQLQTLQQRLLTANIGLQLGNSLAGHQGKIALSVLIPVAKLTAWMSFQFQTMGARLIFDRNVRKMAGMLYDNQRKKPELATETQQYVVMMLLMSDFGQWLNNQAAGPIDSQLQASWDNIELQTLLDYGIPCCPSNLSKTTIAKITQKLETHISRLIEQSAEQKLTATEQKQLHSALQYLKQFAWNGQTQVNNHSFAVDNSSDFLAQLFGASPVPRLMQQPPGNKQAKLAVHSLDELFTLLNNSPMDATTPSPQEKRPLPIKHESTDSSKLYTPIPAQAGAPQDITHFKFNLSENSGYVYPHKIENEIQVPIYSSIQSLPLDELKRNNMSLVPTTLTTVHRICTVLPTHEGTQGAWEAKLLNGGDNRNVLFGISWDRQHDGEQSIPGTTATSIALDAASGIIHYRDPESKEPKEYRFIPMHTGSALFIGISGRQIYFVVNGIASPPIPDFLLPVGADIHPLILIRCPGVKISTRVMGARWSNARDINNDLIDAPSNPVAHAFHLANLRPTTCLHYYAQLTQQQRIDAIPTFTKLVNNQALIAKQEIATQFNLLMLLLAKHECTNETCISANFIQNLRNDLARSSIALDNAAELETLISPSHIIQLAQILGLKELESILGSQINPVSTLTGPRFFSPPLFLREPDPEPTHQPEASPSLPPQ